MSAVKSVLSYVDADEMFSGDPQELADLRLQAMDERFQELRQKISVLDRRAKDAGIDAIRQRSDMVPLLFSHTSYKSYPQTFVEQGRWDLMTKWLTTLSAVEAKSVDLNGVTDVDEWLFRLADAGHYVMASSGTSGKNSFFDQNQADIDLLGYIHCRTLCAPDRFLPLDHNRVVIGIHRTNIGSRGIYAHRSQEEFWAKPGEQGYASEGIPTVGELSRIAALRAKIAGGTAVPTEVQEFESSQSRSAARVHEGMKKMVGIVAERRSEPMVITGLWGLAWQFVLAARELGIEAGDLHPDSVMSWSGGAKNAVMPDDYREQILEWFAPAPQFDQYGMSEMSVGSVRCSAGLYHPTPWVEPFVLDESGENLLPSDGGRVTGRMGFFDSAYEGRWGGIVTGDKATVNYGPCVCGRPGPTIEPDIVRFGAGSPAGDDKLTCSAAVDAYVREAIS